MSDQVNDFKSGSGWNTDASRQAGQWQAQQGQPMSGQQPGESALAFQNRESAYQAEKQK